MLMRSCRRGSYAMLDETLASQFEVSSGDSIQIGNGVFKVSGTVSKIPGGGGIMASFTPSVYISMKELDSTRSGSIWKPR